MVERLQSIAKENPDMSVHVDLDENNDLTVLMIQSNYTRELYDQYPEIIFVDGTYKLNVEGFPLYPIMCEDDNGKGRQIASESRMNKKELSV